MTRLRQINVKKTVISSGFIIYILRCLFGRRSCGRIFVRFAVVVIIGWITPSSSDVTTTTSGPRCDRRVVLPAESGGGDYAGRTAESIGETGGVAHHHADVALLVHARQQVSLRSPGGKIRN